MLFNGASPMPPRTYPKIDVPIRSPVGSSVVGHDHDRQLVRSAPDLRQWHAPLEPGVLVRRKSHVVRYATGGLPIEGREGPAVDDHVNTAGGTVRQPPGDGHERSSA